MTLSLSLIRQRSFLLCLITVLFFSVSFFVSSPSAADGAAPVKLYNSTPQDWQDWGTERREFSLDWLYKRTGWSPAKEGVSDPLVIESCEQFLAVWLGVPKVAEVIQKRRDATDFSRCFAQYFINMSLHPSSASGALRANFSLEAPLKDLAERLNLLSFRSSLRPEYYGRDRLLIADAEGRYDVRHDEKTHSVTLENDHWFFQINIIAAGNWIRHRNNEAMLMVEVIDQAKQGTYLDRTLYLLFAPDREGSFQVFALTSLMAVLFEEWENSQPQ